MPASTSKRHELSVSALMTVKLLVIIQFGHASQNTQNLHQFDFVFYLQMYAKKNCPLIAILKPLRSMQFGRQ